MLYCNLCYFDEILPLVCVLVKQYRFWLTFKELFRIKETQLNTPEMFQVTTGCVYLKLKLPADDDMLI